MRSVLLSAAAVALSGCATTPDLTRAPSTTIGGVAATPQTAASTTAATMPPGGGFRPPQVQRNQGLDRIIGARAERLRSDFGQPRIDLTEGDARKLQFASDSCVLDIFLYPLEPGSAPVATHVEARRPQDGSSFDRADCIRALAQR